MDQQLAVVLALSFGFLSGLVVGWVQGSAPQKRMLQDLVKELAQSQESEQDLVKELALAMAKERELQSQLKSLLDSEMELVPEQEELIDLGLPPEMQLHLEKELEYLSLLALEKEKGQE